MELEREETGAGGPWKPVCIAVGIVAAIGTYLLFPHLDPAARKVAAIGVLMGVWWMTEALPLEATGLVPMVAFPILGVSTVQEACAPYADKIVFLFLGGLLIGAGLERWGLHRRFALVTVKFVGSRPAMLVGGFLFASAFVSMWVSNTATAAMLLPVANSVANLVTQQMQLTDKAFASDAIRGPGRARPGNLSASLMLAVAYGASIGGVGTIIGTPPVAYFVGHMSKAYNTTISFGAWLVIGLPLLAVLLPLTWLILTRVSTRVGFERVEGVRARISEELGSLGSMSRGEWSVAIVFVLAALAWITGSRTGLDDTVIAISAGLALFLIPVNLKRGEFVLTWHEAQKMPWGVLILFGGGLSLAAMISSSGLDKAIASTATGLKGMPVFLVLFAFAAAAIVLTEFMSNIALVAAALPVVGALVGDGAASLGIPASALLIVVTLGASLGFMMPAGTAPNALAFATGHLRVKQMMRAGLWVDLVSAIAAPTVVYVALKLGVLPGM
jgi:solute carrier family 13 (sodium-dependent dicarboxylate transporter), member 2/3/5